MHSLLLTSGGPANEEVSTLTSCAHDLIYACLIDCAFHYPLFDDCSHADLDVGPGLGFFSIPDPEGKI
jgi:hypothetical protein